MGWFRKTVVSAVVAASLVHSSTQLLVKTATDFGLVEGDRRPAKELKKIKQKDFEKHLAQFKDTKMYTRVVNAVNQGVKHLRDRLLLAERLKIEADTLAEKGYGQEAHLKYIQVMHILASLDLVKAAGGADNVPREWIEAFNLARAELIEDVKNDMDAAALQ